MRIEHITNASFVITLQSGAQILTDPWFAETAFHGAWHNFPPLTDEQKRHYLQLKPDFLYISHSHTDHLSPGTLVNYPRTTPVLIGKLPHTHLRRAIEHLGFTTIRELPFGQPHSAGGANVTILGPFGGTADGLTDAVDYALDTSLWVEDADGIRLFNAVDNPVKPQDAVALKQHMGIPDVAILPFAGASFYPHAFTAFPDAEKETRKQAVKLRRLQAFLDVAAALGAKVTVPAAGSYVMGGRIAHYSRYLHQAPPQEIAAAWEKGGQSTGRLVLMAPGDAFDAQSGTVQRAEDAQFRTFTEQQRAEYARSLSHHTLPHDDVRVPSAFPLPWARMLARARRNQWSAQQRLNVFPAADIALEVMPGMGNMGGMEATRFEFALDRQEPGVPKEPATDRRRVTFRVDAGLMLMVLVGGAVWNNLEVGALVECERVPEMHDPTVHSLMSYFTLL